MDGWWPLDVALSSLRAVSTHWIVGHAVGPSPPAASPAFDRRDPASGRLAAASAPLDNSESAPPASVVGMRTMNTKAKGGRRTKQDRHTGPSLRYGVLVLHTKIGGLKEGKGGKQFKLTWSHHTLHTRRSHHLTLRGNLQHKIPSAVSSMDLSVKSFSNVYVRQ